MWTPCFLHGGKLSAKVLLLL